MASSTQWTRVWASSGSWWSSGKPGVLQSTVLQRIGHNWATQLNWTDLQRERETTKAELESFDKNSDSKDLNSNLSSVKWLYLSGSQFPSLMNEFTSQCCSIMAFQGWKRSSRSSDSTPGFPCDNSKELFPYCDFLKVSELQSWRLNIHLMIYVPGIKAQAKGWDWKNLTRVSVQAENRWAANRAHREWATRESRNGQWGWEVGMRL